MPEIGEIRKGNEVGFNTHKKYCWMACYLCGKENWIELRPENKEHYKCLSCSNKMRKHDIGNQKRADEIGRVGRGLFMWHTCIDCGKGRWVSVLRGEPKNIRCHICSCKRVGFIQRSGQHGSRWKGGRLETKEGYIKVNLQPDDFFSSMTDISGYVLEHRLVVAKALGRCLHRWEIVHHKHAKYPAGSIEDKQDNRYPENLELVSDLGHNQITIMENRIKSLEQRVLILEAENILLRGEECQPKPMYG